jgi:cystathionine beta-lyase
MRFKELNPLLHSPLRLAIMSILVSAESADFNYIKEQTCATSGNISVQLDKLQSVGYISIEKHFKGVSAARPEGTYMVFMDCSEWLKEHGMTLDELLKKGWDVGVAWQDGRQHGGTEHIRLSLALPLSVVKEAFKRMDVYVFHGNK